MIWYDKHRHTVNKKSEYKKEKKNIFLVNEKLLEKLDGVLEEK